MYKFFRLTVFFLPLAVFGHSVPGVNRIEGEQIIPDWEGYKVNLLHVYNYSYLPFNIIRKTLAESD